MNMQQWNYTYKDKGFRSFFKILNETLVTQFFRHKTQINLNGKYLDYGFESKNNSFVKRSLEVLDYYFENMSIKINQQLFEYYIVGKKI